MSRIALIILGWLWPELVTSTPAEKSIHWLPQRSCTVEWSPPSQITGGWPPIDRGSPARICSRIEIDSGTGMDVWMLR